MHLNVSCNLIDICLELKQDIDLADSRFEVNLRQAGVDAVATITFRIQQRGVNAEDKQMATRSPKRTGDYSAGHAKRRLEQGRQVAHIDLTLNGDLMRSFTVLDVAPRSATAGFLDDRQADIAEYLEAYFGPIFYLTGTEQDIIIEGLLDRFIDDLRIR